MTSESGATPLHDLDIDSWRFEMDCGGCTGGRFKVRIGDDDGSGQCTSSRTSEDDVWWTTSNIDSDYYTYSESSAAYCDAPNVCGIPNIAYDLEDDVCQVWVYIDSCGD